MKSILKLYITLIIFGISLFPVYAFASSRSGAGQSGESTATISGWSVSNIEYQTASDPSTLNGVSFDLDGAANHVSVKVNSTGSFYTKCTNLYERHWQCNFASGVALSSMDELRVIATGN